MSPSDPRLERLFGDGASARFGRRSTSFPIQWVS
jgi:hypothetical protein